MLVEVWYKNELVEINEQLINEMESKIEKEYDGEYCNYVLSCDWNDGHLCFYPNGPWEC